MCTCTQHSASSQHNVNFFLFGIVFQKRSSSLDRCGRGCSEVYTLLSPINVNSVFSSVGGYLMLFSMLGYDIYIVQHFVAKIIPRELE